MVLEDKLESGGVIVLDGATGSEISRLGGEMSSSAWCALANMTHPNTVRLVHEEYLRAGADVITTNTFATCRHVLAGAGLEDQTVAINKRAVELARQARDNVAASRPVAIAGSMSNMAAWIEGTLSPDPDFFPTRKQEAANQREMANALAEAGADLLILEMMRDIERASLCLEAAVATGLPIWVGLSCSVTDDGHVVGWDPAQEEPHNLSDNEAHNEALALTDIIDALKAIGGDIFGIMHSTIDATQPGLDVLFENWGGPVMAYPETLRPDRKNGEPNPSATPAEFAVACQGYVESGVKIIGGCCGTTIEHIRAMVDALPDEVGQQKIV